MAWLDDNGVITLTSEIKDHIDNYYISTKVGSITLDSDDWVGESSPWSQVISISGRTITANTMVNLRASTTTLAQLQGNDITEIVAENDAGEVTVYCRGLRAPKADITLQYSLIDISKTGNAIVIGDPVVVGCLDYWDFTDAEFTADTGTTSEVGGATNGMISNGWVLINLDFTLKALTSGTEYKLCELSEDLYMKIGRTYRKFSAFTVNGVRVTVLIDTWSTNDDVPYKSINITPKAAVSSGDTLIFGMVFPVSYNL